MKDLRTTIPGLIAGLAMLAKALNFDIPKDVLDGITAVALFLLGFFAKQA